MLLRGDVKDESGVGSATKIELFRATPDAISCRFISSHTYLLKPPHRRSDIRDTEGVGQ